MRGTRPLKRPELLQGHRRHAQLRSVDTVPTEAPPSAPGGLSADGAMVWERLWRSKLACAWNRETDLCALTRYVLNLDKWVQYEAMVARVPMVKGSKGQLRPNPLAARMDALEGQLRFTEEQYGLTPASRIRLGIEVAAHQKSVAELLLESLNRGYDEDLPEIIDLDNLQ